MADAGLLSDEDVGLSAPLMSDADVGIALAPSKTGPLTNTGDEGLVSGGLKNAATGAIKGAGDAVGFAGNIGDLASYLTDRGEQGIRYLAGYPKSLDDIRADNAAALAKTKDLESQTGLGRVVAATNPRSVLPDGASIAAPILAKTGDYKPDSYLGELGQSAIEAVVGAIGPSGGGAVAGATRNALLKTAIKQAPHVAATGVVGQAVTDQTDDPLLGMLAGASAGSAASAGAHGFNKVVEPFAEKLPVVGKLYTGTQDRLAGENLLSKASDPAAFKNALSPGPMQPDADSPIPGFKPTTAQLTGDRGIGQAERGDAAVNPAGYIDRRDAQNLAVARNIDAMTPTGSPEAVTTHLKDRLAAMDGDAETQIGLARQVAQDEASKIGTGAGPEVTGDDLRTHVAVANRAASDNARELWKAVDPNGTLANSMTPIKQAAARIYGGLTDTAKEFVSPEEEKFSRIIGGYAPVEPFQQLGDLRSNLASAMRQERAANGSTPAYARMSQLMDTVQGTINSAIEGRAAQEAHAVAQGVMSPEDTMVARVKQKWADDAARSYAGGELAGVGTGHGGVSFGRAASDVGANGTASTAAIRSLGSPSNTGVPAQAPLEPNFPADAVDRLKAATKATKDIHQTFDNGVPGDLLATRGSAGDYKLSNSAVPAKVLKPGPAGYDAIKQYMKATNASPAAELALSNAWDEHMRSKAIGDDGMVHPGKLAVQKKLHAHGLRAMDEAFPGFSSRYDDATKATQTVMAETAAQKAMREHYQTGIVGKLLGADGEDEIVNRFGRIMNADDRVPQINKLIAATRNNPDAVAGLRKTAAMWMARQFKTQTEIGASGEKQVSADAFKKIVQSKAPVLARLFTSDEMSNFSKIATALDIGNRSITSKIAGSPGTAQDLHQAAKGHGGKPASSIGEALKNGAMLGYLAHGVHGAAYGAASGAASHVVNTLRAMGVDSINKLYTDALLNPERARYYLSRVPEPNEHAFGKMIASSLRRSFLTVPQMVRSQSGPNAPQPTLTVGYARAAGGRVYDQDEPVAHITGEEIAPRDASLEDLRDHAKAYYQAHLKNTSVHSAALGHAVEFKRSRKAFSASGNPDKLRMFAAVRDVIAKGRHVETTRPKDQSMEPSTKAYHYLEAKVGTPEGHRLVGATVREDTNGHLYYNHSMRDEDGRSRLSAPEGTAGKARPGDAGGGTALSENIDPAGEDNKRAAGGRVDNDPTLYRGSEGEPVRLSPARPEDLRWLEDLPRKRWEDLPGDEGLARWSHPHGQRPSNPSRSQLGSSLPSPSPDPRQRADGGRVEPTDAQKEAGNYRKDHVRFRGMDITIENRKGETRSGVGKDGKRWSTTMPAPYGYIRGTTGADGDHVDCYLGPDEDAPYAWVINQMDLQPRRFDEHKVMLGFKDRAEALKTYERGFSDGKGAQRIGKITCVQMAHFPKWVKDPAKLAA